MEPKREKRRSRQIHFPAEDEVYKPFLEDDTNVDSLNNNEEHLAEIKLGKFLKRDTDTECQTNKQKVEDKPTPPQVTVTSTTTLKTQEKSHKTGSYLKYESPSPYHGGREEVFKQKTAYEISACLVGSGDVYKRQVGNRVFLCPQMSILQWIHPR